MFSPQGFLRKNPKKITNFFNFLNPNIIFVEIGHGSQNSSNCHIKQCERITSYVFLKYWQKHIAKFEFKSNIFPLFSSVIVILFVQMHLLD